MLKKKSFILSKYTDKLKVFTYHIYLLYFFIKNILLFSSPPIG